MIKKIMSMFKKEKASISQNEINKLIVKSGGSDIYIDHKNRDVDVPEFSDKPRVKSSTKREEGKCECGGNLAKNGNMISGNSKFEIMKCTECNKEKMKAIGVVQ